MITKKNALRLAIPLIGATLVSGCGAAELLGLPFGQKKPVESVAPAPGPGAASPVNVAQNEYFARVRGADSCEIVRSDYLKKFGPEQRFIAQSLTECLAGSFDNANPDTYMFYFNTFDTFDPAKEQDRIIQTEQIAGLTAFQTEPPSSDSTGHRSCNYKLQLPGAPATMSLRAVLNHPKDKQQEPWPEACQTAKEYLGSLGNKLQLPPRTTPAESFLVGKDPCAAVPDIAQQFPQWRISKVTPLLTQCEIEFDNGKDQPRHSVSIWFRRDVKPGVIQPTRGQATAENFAGFESVRTTDQVVNGRCGNQLIVKPQSRPDSKDAHIMSVNFSTMLPVTTSAQGDPIVPGPAQPDCASADKTTQAVLHKAQQQ